MYQVQLVVTIVCETEPIYRETGWSDFNLSHISCLFIQNCPLLNIVKITCWRWHFCGGEGCRRGWWRRWRGSARPGWSWSRARSPAASRSWGSGKFSFHLYYKMFAPSQWNSPQVWGAEEVFDCKDGQVGEGEEARQRSCKGCRVVLKKFEKSNKELSCKNKLEEKTQWRKGLSCKKICWFENIECLGTLRPAQQTYVAADLIVTLRHMTIVIFAVWALFYIAAVLWRQFWTNKIKVELGRPVFKRGEIYIYMYLLWEYGRGTI